MTNANRQITTQEDLSRCNELLIEGDDLVEHYKNRLNLFLVLSDQAAKLFAHGHADTPEQDAHIMKWLETYHDARVRS